MIHAGQACNDVTGQWLGIGFGSAIGAIVVLVGLACWAAARPRVFRRLRLLSIKYTPLTKLKILIGFWMVSSNVPHVYEIELPSEVPSTASPTRCLMHALYACALALLSTPLHANPL